MMLEVCRKDFEALIRRFELQKEYEKNEREGRLVPKTRGGWCWWWEGGLVGHLY